MELNKNNIVKILEENTDWFEDQYQDLIHKGKFEKIADEIIKLNYTHSSTHVKEKEIPTFDEWCNLNNYTKTTFKNLLAKNNDLYDIIILKKWYKEEHQL